MATIRKRKNGKYQAIIRKNGHQISKTFTLKRDAEHFAKTTEVAIETRQFQRYDEITLGEVIEHYINENQYKKSSFDADKVLFSHLKKYYQYLLIKPIAEITAKELAVWRDNRLNEVKSSTVRRQWNSFSSVFTFAKFNLGLNLPDNPFHLFKRPEDSQPRWRRISEEEIKEILERLNYDGNSEPKTIKQKTAWVFLFAIETACRLGEICKLKQEDIHPNLIDVRETKNGTDRTVPLTEYAKKLLKLIPKDFKINSCTIGNCFSTNISKHMIDIHFHDTRHEGISRMAQIITNPIILAKITGHKDLKILLKVYCNTTNQELEKVFN